MGYQVDPVIQEGPNGEVVTDFAVSGSDSRMAAIEHMNAYQQDWIHEDEFGQHHHEAGLEQPELSQVFEDDFEGELTDEQALQEAQAQEDAFYDATVKWCGGEDNYQALTDWALQNWDSEEIDVFNQIMNNNSFEDRALAVKFMALKYHQHHQQQ